MSDIIDPELDQDPIDATSAVVPVEADSNVDVPADDATDEKQSLKDKFLKMSLWEAMLLISLVLIGLATLRLFTVLRVYSEGFPFGGFPWSTSEFQILMW
jgi:hypothetical protein